MLRTVEEIRNQTREAIEDDIMRQIEEASRERKLSIDVLAKDVPDWLVMRLGMYGYSITKDSSTYNIYWGCNDAQ